jgi:hypothetical protein
VILSLLCITDVLAAFKRKWDSNTVTATFQEWPSTDHQQYSALHLGQFMFRLVADIHLSDIASLFWENPQWHAPRCILTMSINKVSARFSFAFWEIFVPIGCRHLFIQYLQPLLGKTTPSCSLQHPESGRQRSVNSFSCCILGNQGMMRIFTFVMALLTTLIG